MSTYACFALEVSIGKYGLGDIFNDKDPGAVAAADVEFNQPGRTSSHNVSNNIFSSSSTILVGDGNGFIHKFDEDKFTPTNKSKCAKPSRKSLKRTRSIIQYMLFLFFWVSFGYRKPSC